MDIPAEQSKAPCRKTKIVKNFFQKDSVTVMDWPAQSPVSTTRKFVRYKKSAN